MSTSSLRCFPSSLANRLEFQLGLLCSFHSVCREKVGGIRTRRTKERVGWWKGGNREWTLRDGLRLWPSLAGITGMLLKNEVVKTFRSLKGEGAFLTHVH